jgi:hypothetical protein
MNGLGLERTRQHVGHLAQKALLYEAASRIAAERRCLALYIEAQGGLGKTRLLEDCPGIIAEVCPDIRAPGMIDIYDYANHNTTWIEHQLVLGLQEEYPGQPYRLPADQARRFFDRYDTLHLRYTNDPSTSGSFALTQMFVRCWNALASYYPLLIRFDTIEKLFVRSAPAGALISGDAGITSANLVLEWLKMVLPLLRHTLVLFSGRPITANPLVALLRRLGVLIDDVQVLQPLDDPADIHAYMDVDETALDDSQIQHIQYVTEGRPLLLTCYAEQLQQRLRLPGEPRSRLEFEDLLIETILNPLAQPDLAHRTLAYGLYVLSYARRGIQRADLRRIFERLGIECDDALIDRIGALALIKTVRLAQAPGSPAEPDLLLLHDEIYQLLDSSGQPDALGLRDLTLAYLCEKSREQVLRTNGRGSNLLRAMSNHMYYELTRDIGQGYRVYTDYIDYLLSIRQDRNAVILADAFWATITARAPRDGQETYPYLNTLLQAKDVHYETIMRDEQVRRVKLLRVRDQLKSAIDLANALFAQFERDGIIPPDTDAGQELPTYPHPYLFVDLGIAWANVTVQVAPQDNPQLERFLDRLIDLLRTPDRHSDRLQRRAQLFLSEVYGLRGYLRERQQRFEAAITSLGEGRDAFQTYRAGAQSDEILPSSWYTFRLAQMINNLAMTHARIGDLDYALELSNKILTQHINAASNYYCALFYNTNAQISIYRNDFDQASKVALLARKAGERADSPRANGLAKWTMAIIDRRRMNEQQEPNPDLFEIFDEVIRLLQNEPAMLCDIYNDYARVARDMAWLYRARGDIETAHKYEQRALDRLHIAIGYLSSAPSLQRADLLETMVSVYNSMGDQAHATELLEQIEQLMHVEMSRYRHVLCGKLALQHGLAAYHTGRYQDTLRLLTIALARAVLFAPKHRDRAAFELIITQVLAGTPTNELQQFRQAIQDERVYIAAGELPYQRPEPAEWAEAWDISLRFIDDTIEQTQLRVSLRV